jgi:hypothetical protein
MTIAAFDLARMRTLRNADDTTVDELDRLLAIARADHAEAEALVDDLNTTIGTPHWSDTRQREFERQDARADLLLAVRGATADDAISHPRLAARIGLPGLAEWQRLIPRLEALREQASARDAGPWPRAFRYTGKPGRHVMEGRHLEPGHVVMLTRGQALAWHDRFEQVVEDDVATELEPT